MDQLDLGFVFMSRVIDSRSGDKHGDSDGTLFQSDGKTLILCRWHLHVFPLFIKPTGRGEFIFKELALEGVHDVDHALLFLASQIQKEHCIEHLLVLLWY